MKEIAVFARFMELYTQAAHWAVGRSTFLQDHEWLGDLYESYGDIVDKIAERMIGLKIAVNLIEINIEAAAMLSAYKDQVVVKNSAYFVNIYGFEKELVKLLTAANESATLGTQNLLQDECDSSEARQYKIGQRIDAEV